MANGGGDDLTFSDQVLGVGGGGVVVQREPEPMATISRQDFDILREGSSESQAVSQRNMLWSCCVSLATALVGLYVSVDVFKIESGWLSRTTIMFVLLAIAVLVTGILGWFRHSDARLVRSKRGVYQTTEQRIGKALDKAEAIQRARQAQQPASPQAQAAQAAAAGVKSM
jgi:hypothetical protein